MEAGEGAPVRFVQQNVLGRDLVANLQILADANITWVMSLGEGLHCGMGICAIDAGSAENSGESIPFADFEFVFDHWVRWIRQGLAGSSCQG